MICYDTLWDKSINQISKFVDKQLQQYQHIKYGCPSVMVVSDFEYKSMNSKKIPPGTGKVSVKEFIESHNVYTAVTGKEFKIAFYNDKESIHEDNSIMFFY